jgi:hypothetical protein
MTAHNSDSPNLQKEAVVSLNSLPFSDDPLFVFRPFGALTLRFVDCATLFERLPVSADDETGGPVECSRAAILNSDEAYQLLEAQT